MDLGAKVGSMVGKENPNLCDYSEHTDSRGLKVWELNRRNRSKERSKESKGYLQITVNMNNVI
jgi:hypothetical protein